jgi:glycosyltransferase involved in cell wall biosynthesis
MDGTGVEHRILAPGRWVTNADVPDADVVLATWWQTAEHVAKLSSCKGAKAYFIQHDEQTAFDDDLGHMRPRVCATWSLPFHKIVIARWLVELARQRCGDEPVSYVPNAVDPEQFHAETRGKQYVPTVGLMYSSARFKGVDVSLRAFTLASKKIPRLQLVAFGMGEPEECLPLPPGTEYLRQPAQDRIREIYSRCDAWLFGSRSEGFGLPILEAMACRTPVIGTPMGAAPELLADGCGILVKADDPGDMAEAICRVATMPEQEWRSMSTAAHARAIRYTWDDATNLFESALHAAIAYRDHNLLRARAL